MWRRLRIAVLLFILASVALSAWQQKRHATAWTSTLQVAVMPIAGDDSPVTRRYLARLTRDDFQPMADYLNGEAQRYGVRELLPVALSLAPEVRDLPPAQPREGGVLKAVVWSLKLRYWAWSHTPALSPKPRIRLYLIYHDPARNPAVPHSAGLEKGLLGVVHLFASDRQRGENLVVATHELLHTLGATDKYEPGTNQPRYPEGYADPQQQPLLPQTQAEIMAGRIPLTPTQAEIPPALGRTLIGPATAKEIGWR